MYWKRAILLFCLSAENQKVSRVKRVVISMTSPDPWRTEFALRKQRLALRLVTKEYGGSYGDEVMMLCAVITALAAEVWPGKGKDRHRFVEVLKDFARELKTTHISIPLLSGYLRLQKGREVEKGQLEGIFTNDSLVLTRDGDVVDRSEEEIIAICPKLTCKEIRACSYANLLYTEIRSGYAHEYRPGNRAVSSLISSVQPAVVSYENWSNDPKSKDYSEEQTDWRIYFNADWIGDVAVAVAKAMDAAGEFKRPVSDQPVAGWWLDGGIERAST